MKFHQWIWIVQGNRGWGTDASIPASPLEIVAARNSGIVLPVVGGLLAATALEHNLTLVTRNSGQIPAMGVAVSIRGKRIEAVTQ